MIVLPSDISLVRRQPLDQRDATTLRQTCQSQSCPEISQRLYDLDTETQAPKTLETYMNCPESGPHIQSLSTHDAVYERRRPIYIVGWSWHVQGRASAHPSLYPSTTQPPYMETGPMTGGTGRGSGGV